MLCPSCGIDTGAASKFCPSCGTTLVRSVEADDYIGKLIKQKYRVEAMIGEGGMGKVYRATQVALDKLVVLKVLRHTLLSDQRTVQRFHREAKAASRLNHPNSISMLDFGEAEDGALFIAMEYVSGKDLHQILSKEWPLPEPRIIRIVGQVLSALADAHGAGVIHRDLKPENIMVEQRRGEPDFVKVLDFGIAKIQDSTSEDGPALTRTGFVCGTPEYMSPEQARGAVLDHRSDLYAVGVILYQLATGLLPFESDSAVGFATKHLTEEPLPPSRRRPDARISPAMEKLILRALSKNPNDRPQGAEAFRAELLAVEKARVPAGARQGPAVLTPPPRYPTPTELSSPLAASDPQWGQEATVRAVPTALVAGGGATQAMLQSPTAGQGGMLLFKVITIALVLVAGALAAYNLSLFGGGTEPFVPPVNAPLPHSEADAPHARLYELELPQDKRDAAGAQRLEREGDEAQARGRPAEAIAKYREAFALNPEPGLALKLGELSYQQNDAEAARGWWGRHLRDHARSNARPYIQQVFSDL